MIKAKQKITNKEEFLQPVDNDIYVIKEREEVSYDKDGNKIVKTIKERYNLTKKINETSKVIKQMNAEERLKAINEYFEKGEQQ